jgi:hypothetical protein
MKRSQFLRSLSSLTLPLSAGAVFMVTTGCQQSESEEVVEETADAVEDTADDIGDGLEDVVDIDDP